jgi:hypothetical protein
LKKDFWSRSEERRSKNESASRIAIQAFLISESIIARLSKSNDELSTFSTVSVRIERFGKMAVRPLYSQQRRWDRR